MKKIRRYAFGVLLLLLLFLLGFEAFRYAMDGGVSHRELKDAIGRESDAIQSHLDARCDALERRLDSIESKLGGIDSKLDRLIDMATPKLPGGMVPSPVVQ